MTAQTGGADYPVRYSYDTTDGCMTSLKTYRDGDGWNCLLRAMAIGYADATWEQGYIWGPDLSGTMQGAGGVGGLLIQNYKLDTLSIRRLVGYDGNGNVTTLADGANGQLWALYEYDAFGNPTRHHNAIGTHADDNPYRFSTKPMDDETGLVYYGYRYYSPALGKWISRDPIGEWGGHHLMAFVDNKLSVDILGLTDYDAQPPANATVTSGPTGTGTSEWSNGLLGDYAIWNTWSYTVHYRVRGACHQTFTYSMWSTFGWNFSLTVTDGGQVQAGVGGANGAPSAGVAASITTAVGVGLSGADSTVVTMECEQRQGYRPIVRVTADVSEISDVYVDWGWASGDMYPFHLHKFTYREYDCEYEACDSYRPDYIPNTTPTKKAATVPRETYMPRFDWRVPLRTPKATPIPAPQLPKRLKYPNYPSRVPIRQI